MDNKDWYKKSSEKVLEDFKTSMQGLTNKEFLNRQKEQGLNVLPKKKQKKVYEIFFSNFKDPIIIVLLVAVFLSFIVGEVLDAIAILLIIF